MSPNILFIKTLKISKYFHFEHHEVLCNLMEIKVFFQKECFLKIIFIFLFFIKSFAYLRLTK